MTTIPTPDELVELAQKAKLKEAETPVDPHWYQFALDNAICALKEAAFNGYTATSTNHLFRNFVECFIAEDREKFVAETQRESIYQTIFRHDKQCSGIMYKVLGVLEEKGYYVNRDSCIVSWKQTT